MKTRVKAALDCQGSGVQGSGVQGKGHTHGHRPGPKPELPGRGELRISCCGLRSEYNHRIFRESGNTSADTSGPFKGYQGPMGIKFGGV